LIRDAVADLVLLDAPTHLHIPYRPDADLVAAVVKGGVIL
jgi:imidazolonepropionase-like amidohydrolase